jgi:hypothetical protein
VHEIGIEQVEVRVLLFDAQHYGGDARHTVTLQCGV